MAKASERPTGVGQEYANFVSHWAETRAALAKTPSGWRKSAGNGNDERDLMELIMQDRAQARAAVSGSGGRASSAPQCLAAAGAGTRAAPPPPPQPEDQQQDHLWKRCVSEEAHSDLGDGQTAEEKIGVVPREELEKLWDLVVIGGGPAGVAAGNKCAFLGRRALIVDRPKLPPDADTGLDVSFGGPTGLWSKALRDVGKSLDVKTLRAMHLDEDVIWQQVRGSCLKLATHNATHQVSVLKNHKVSYLQATAQVQPEKGTSPEGEPELRVLCALPGGRSVEIRTTALLIATGSRPMPMPSVPFDDRRIFNADSIAKLAFLPHSVCISGSGIIAIEFAKIFRKLGAKVTMLVRGETMGALKRIGLDRDVAAELINSLTTDDVTIVEGVEVGSFEVPRKGSSDPVVLKLKSKAGPVEDVRCDCYLAATGRVPNSDGFGLEGLGVKIKEKGGQLEVDATFQTNVPGVYGCGDVLGPPALASTGVYQAMSAVEQIFQEGMCSSPSLPQFPIGMWTTPEVGYYGHTLESAEKKGLDVEEGKTSYSGCLRGRVFAPEGMVKLVFKKSDGAIVGVHIMGRDACELIHYGMDLVMKGTTIFEVMTTIVVAVTFHELFAEAARDGNSKLAFGIEWQKIFSELGANAAGLEDAYDKGEAKRIFDSIDVDGSGALDPEELAQFFKKMGHDMKRSTLANLVRLSDADNSGTIDWEEFDTIMRTIRAMGKGTPQAQLIGA